MDAKIKQLEIIINKCDEGTWRNDMVKESINTVADFEKLRWKGRAGTDYTLYEGFDDK